MKDYVELVETSLESIRLSVRLKDRLKSLEDRYLVKTA